jgi:glycosyltransferase involved in cell wall biosynthesis
MSEAPPIGNHPQRRYLYVAYTLSLTLKAANAVQTYQTARHLRDLAAAQGATLTLVMPRWLREPSLFDAALGPAVRYLPRIPFNKLTRFWKSSAFSYLERTAWSAELLTWLLWRRLTGRRFAAIYVRDVVCAYWLVRARALHGAPVIYEIHDLEATNPSRAKGALWARWRRSLDLTTLRRPARLVSLTAIFRAFLDSRRLRPATDVDVIPDAYDDSLYDGSSRAAARAALGLPDNAFIAGYAGLTFAYRRLDLLVEAFAALHDRLGEERPLLLVLAGGRPAELVDLRAHAAELGLPVLDAPADAYPPAALLVPGQVSQAEVVRYLYAADALVIPDTVTTLTASPLKLFEYMAAGRAIVLRQLPALREILGDAGIYFPPGDGAALAEALERLARDPALADRLGAAAAERAARYTYEERARRVLAVLARVAGDPVK